MADRGFVDPDSLLKQLKDIGIETTTRYHEEVMTVEALLEQVGDVPGAHTKNLFMKDKKKNLWLLSARHQADVNLSQLAKMVGAPGGLRFTDESVLYDTLGVKAGCVTAFALINDKEKKVKFLIDEELLSGDHEVVHFHPLTNSATTAIKPQDLLAFLKHTGHEHITVKFSTKTE